MTPEEQRAATEALALEDPEVVEERNRARFAEQLAAIVQEQCAGEALTTGDVARRFGVPRDVAKDAMGKLADAGSVEVVGAKLGAVGVWKVASRAETEQVDPVAETEREPGAKP